MKFPKMVNAYIQILKKAGIKFSTNLETKTCCGAPAFNIRELNTAKDLASKNKKLIESTGAKIVISDCPGCILTLLNRYQKEGIDLNVKVIHIVTYINDLMKKGKLKVEKTIPEDLKKVTIHDPCHLARNLNDTTSIRRILGKISGLEIVEPLNNKENTHCCGWSGTLHWADESIATKEVENRVSELLDTGAMNLISACPLCELALARGFQKEEKEKIKILDISELVLKVL